MRCRGMGVKWGEVIVKRARYSDAQNSNATLARTVCRHTDGERDPQCDAAITFGPDPIIANRRRRHNGVPFAVSLHKLFRVLQTKYTYPTTPPKNRSIAFVLG